MTLLLRSSALAALALVLATAALAQETQKCPSGQAVCAVASAQYLNRVVNGDTTAAGARLRADRVYELARGGIYLMDASIRNTGYTLRLRGAAGTGALPAIYTTVNANSGGRVGDAFFQEGDIEMRDFIFSGVIDDPILNPAGFTIMSNSVLRVAAAGFDLTLDGVVWTNVVAQMIRAESALRVFRMTNSVWANAGYLGTGGTNFGAGKGIDLRTGSIDSLIFRNNTFVNYTDRIIRHRSSTAPIGVMIFDHNTVMDAVSYHGTLALGQVGQKIQITNNLFLDSFVAGADTSDIVRQAEFDESGEVYPNGKAKMTWILSEPNETTNWTVSNNVYSVSPAVQAFYTRYGDGGGNDGNPDNGTDGDNDIIGEGAPLTDHIMGRIASPATAFVKMDLDVTERPSPMINMVTWYREETGRTKSTTSFNLATDDYDRKTVDYFAGTLDASYPTTSPAYTAATGGCPVGDLNWFPEVSVAACLATAVEGETARAGFGLTSAPNPLRDTATLHYTLDRYADVRLAVYDVLGREVATLAEGAQSAGSYTTRWAAAGVAPGVYLVRLQAGPTVATRRVVVVR